MFPAWIRCDTKKTMIFASQTASATAEVEIISQDSINTVKAVHSEVWFPDDQRETTKAVWKKKKKLSLNKHQLSKKTFLLF